MPRHPPCTLHSLATPADRRLIPGHGLMRGAPTPIPADITAFRHPHRNTNGPGCEPFAEKGARPALTPPLKGARAAVTLLVGIGRCGPAAKDPSAASWEGRHFS